MALSDLALQMGTWMTVVDDVIQRLAANTQFIIVLTLLCYLSTGSVRTYQLSEFCWTFS